MSEENNGGNAFPRAIHDDYDKVNGNIYPANGITLRDYLAIRIYASAEKEAGKMYGDGIGNVYDIARICYIRADAMLEARKL